MADEVPERRKSDVEWREYVTDSINKLNAQQADIQKKIALNNEMTEIILSILSNTRAFWNFLTKASHFIIKIAKVFAVFAFIGSFMYSCSDAIQNHSIAVWFKNIWKWDKIP